MIFPDDTQCHQRNQTVFVVAFVVINVATDIWDPQRIPVTTDSRHHTVVDPFCLIVFFFFLPE
jgi:hypothetical protein